MLDSPNCNDPCTFVYISYAMFHQYCKVATHQQHIIHRLSYHIIGHDDAILIVVQYQQKKRISLPAMKYPCIAIASLHMYSYTTHQYYHCYIKQGRSPSIHLLHTLAFIIRTKASTHFYILQQIIIQYTKSNTVL
jgi:hypothetical protein